jgi:GDP-mannose 6-dehydrogenase
MNISVFGLGYVGCISLGCLAQDGHKVIGVDVNATKVNQVNSGRATVIEKDIDRFIKDNFLKGNIEATTDYVEAVLKTELSIVTVGTPSSPNGHLDLTYIFNVAGQIGEGLRQKDTFHIINLRSTVLPGTSREFASIIEDRSKKKKDIDFAVVVNPEFLREGTAVYDYYNPPFTLIGSNNDKAISKIKKLYEKLPGEIMVINIEVAELIKCINNAFHALKVTFANEIGNICQALNIDPYKIMEIFI